jgi:outer membrane protein
LYWPTFSLEGVYSRTENDPSRTFEINETLFATASLNVPLFEGGLRRAEVKEAEAKQRQADLSYDDLKKEITIDVERAYLEFITQKGILQSLEDQLAFSRENFTTVEKQFYYGLADSVDVMDANTLLVTAERELARTKYNYQLAILRLKWATGTLLKTVTGTKTTAK